MIHYMIDIETLATGSNSLVLSIALVKFNQSEIIDTIVLYPDLIQQDKRGRKIDINTLSWWLKNSELLKNTIDQKRKSLNFCYHQIQYFLTEKSEQTRLWSKSPSFDLQILNHLFQDWGNPISTFRMEADVRTAEFKLNQNSIPLEKPTNAHEALSDAIAQAKNIQNFLKL